jgi:hypothetical protein
MAVWKINRWNGALVWDMTPYNVYGGLESVNVLSTGHFVFGGYI